MAQGSLDALWKLHRIDAEIAEIRSRAAALDPGRAIQAQLKRLTDDEDGVLGRAKKLRTELTDLELSQKAIDAKLAQIDKTLYGGNVVNPREVQAYEREMESLRQQRGRQDDRILAIWDELPPIEEAAKAREAEIAELNAKLAEHQQGIRRTKEEMESAFKQRTAERPVAVAAVDPALLSRYEQIRQKHGTGMARISKTGNCEACGLKLAEKVRLMAQEDRLVTCEQCHRILYFNPSIAV